MKSKGFIATSLLYSFFIIFCTLIISLLGTFLHNRLLLSTLTNNIKEELSNIKSRTAANFKTGDHVEMSLYLAGKHADDSPDEANEHDIMWVVFKQEADFTFLISKASILSTPYYNNEERIDILKEQISKTANPESPDMDIEARFLKTSDLSDLRGDPLHPLIVRESLLPPNEKEYLIYQDDATPNEFKLLSDCFAECTDDNCLDNCKIKSIPGLNAKDVDDPVDKLYNIRLILKINSSAKVQSGRGQIRDPYVFVKDGSNV